MRTISASALGLFFLLASASAQATEPAQTNAEVPSHFAQVPGAKLYYEECNAAAPISVVLLHDGLLHSVTWDGVADAEAGLVRVWEAGDATVREHLEPLRLTR